MDKDDLGNLIAVSLFCLMMLFMAWFGFPEWGFLMSAICVIIAVLFLFLYDYGLEQDFNEIMSELEGIGGINEHVEQENNV